MLGVSYIILEMFADCKGLILVAFLASTLPWSDACYVSDCSPKLHCSFAGFYITP